MTQLAGWRAYYPDGSTMDSSEASPAGLPDGVVCIVEFLEPPYREVVAGGDFYVHDDGRWTHTGTGDWGQWQQPPHGVAVRSTGRLPDEQYEAVLKAAMEDDRWP